jgi:hypothetical protein
MAGAPAFHRRAVEPPKKSLFGAVGSNATARFEEGLLYDERVMRVHHAAAAFVVLLPLAGLVGDAGLAFTMYAASVRYRLEITATDDAGRRHAIAPTALATRVSPSAAPFFAGADNLRRTYDVRRLRVRLPEVARLACAVDAGRARRVEVTLVELAGQAPGEAAGAPRTTRAEASCAK